MTLQEAAEHLGVTKKKLWRAIKAGQLVATQVQNGQRWEYRVSLEAIEIYRDSMDPSDETGNDLDRSSSLGTDRSGTFRNESERSGTGNVPDSRPRERDGTSGPIPPAEVYIALIDRLSRAERRSVELELQLRQSQRLLSENAESISEKMAMAQQAQARIEDLEKVKQQEVDDLRAELESTRQQLEEAHKPSGLFSWLGLRRRRVTVTSAERTG